jgi:hypothetical protein
MYHFLPSVPCMKAKLDLPQPCLQSQSAPGQQNASGTSEQRRGEDVTQNTKQEYEGSSSVGMKTGSENLIDSVERSVHEGGDSDRSGVDIGQVTAGR